MNKFAYNGVYCINGLVNVWFRWCVHFTGACRSLIRHACASAKISAVNTSYDVKHNYVRVSHSEWKCRRSSWQKLEYSYVRVSFNGPVFTHVATCIVRSRKEGLLGTAVLGNPSCMSIVTYLSCVNQSKALVAREGSRTVVTTRVSVNTIGKRLDGKKRGVFFRKNFTVNVWHGWGRTVRLSLWIQYKNHYETIEIKMSIKLMEV